MNDLFQIEPSEEEMYREAVSQPLDRKVDSAVELLRMFGTNAIVCFSGGKDSVVIKDLARRAWITQSIYSVTTIDPPELIHFIKDHHSDTVWNRQPQHMLQYMVDHAK